MKALLFFFFVCFVNSRTLQNSKGSIVSREKDLLNDVVGTVSDDQGQNLGVSRTVRDLHTFLSNTDAKNIHILADDLNAINNIITKDLNIIRFIITSKVDDNGKEVPLIKIDDKTTTIDVNKEIFIPTTTPRHPEDLKIVLNSSISPIEIGEKNIPGILDGHHDKNGKTIGFRVRPKEFTQNHGEKNKSLIESDILLMNETPEEFLASQKKHRNSIYDHLWPNGILVYKIASGQFNKVEQQLIMSVLKYIESYSCIKFKERTNEYGYVQIIRGSGCYSSIGFYGGRQTLSLGTGCLNFGTIIHELYHALGFYHEQSRVDRDKYITIYVNNIIPGTEYNFEKYSGQIFTPYDYKSLMHYDNQAFTKDWSKNTIVANDGTPLLHSSIKKYPSLYDQNKLNLLYRCSDKIKTCYDKHPLCEVWITYNRCTTFLETACPESCANAENRKCDETKMEIKDFDPHCDFLKKDYCYLEYSQYVCLKSCPKIY